MPFSVPKWHICPEQNFFGTNHYYYFHLPIGPFHCAKFKKNSYCRSRIIRICYFWAQNGPFGPIFFFWKIINIILIYLLASFIVQNFKNSSSGSRVMMMHNFWAQNGQFAQMSIFFRKPVNEPCFFH